MSNTRSDRGFRFPLQKYDHQKALYTNFRYLQDYLNYIRKKDKFAATVDIALKGSSAEERAQYVADGTNDHTEIQAAIDALPSSGGHVYIHEGTYDLQATISLPGKKVILSGPGVLNFNGTTTNFGRGFTGASAGEYIIHGGLSFTGDVRDAQQSDRGSQVFHQNGAEWYVSGCKFYSLSAEVIFSGGKHTVVNNEFYDIELRRGTGATDESVIIGRVDGGGNAFGVFAGNYLDGLTTTAAQFSNDSYYIAREDSGHVFVVGNHFDDVNGLTSNFRSGVIHSHNMINSTMVSGDHSDVDHGTLSGLTDDDHTQYVLRSILTTQGDIFKRGASAIERLALGTTGQFLKSDGTDPLWATLVEADISDLDHDDTDAIHDNVAGEINALTAPTLASGDVVLIEDADDSFNKKKTTVADIQSAETDHGGLTGLGDDDHTQYLNETRHGNEHPYLRADNTGGAGDQALSSTVATQVALDNLVSESDADGDFSFSDANDDITINTAGVYMVTAGVAFDANSDSTRRSGQIRINGSTVKGETIVGALNSVTQATIIQVTALGDLAVNDTVELWARQDSGGSLNVAASTRTFLAIARIS